jgi:hypothetical protein
MPEFIMEGKHDRAFRALDDFTQGYIEAAFFTCGNECGTLPGPDADENGEGDNREVGFEDLAPEALAAIMADCDSFRDDAKIVAAIQADEAKAGRDFWYTRNGHGCGFWDGDWEKLAGEDAADALDARARAFREVDLYLGDDGKVYLS